METQPAYDCSGGLITESVDNYEKAYILGSFLVNHINLNIYGTQATGFCRQYLHAGMD
jgi:hypothetical protein